MHLKRGIAVLCLGAAAIPALANDLSQIQTLNQTQFRQLSEDLAAAISYKPLTPTAPLGLTGFDLGIAATATQLQHSDVFKQATNGGDYSTVALPSLRFDKGLPFDIDVGLMAGGIPGTNVRVWGGALRWAPISGEMGLGGLAVGIRGSYTKLAGVDQLSMSTAGADISASVRVLMFTPYAGGGKVWVDSTPVNMPAGTPTKESFSLSKTFVGVNANFGIVNLAVEGDRTGGAKSYGLKLGFRF